jgi:type 1 glutamine amidotransferase
MNRPPRWLPPALAFAALLPLLAAAATPAPSADPWAPYFHPDRLRALILSGRCNHDWRTSTPFLRRLLVDSGRFDVRVTEAVDGLTRDTLAPYDVLVMDHGGPRWPAVTEKAVEDFVREGKGFVLVHGAVYHFSGLDVITDGHRPVGLKEPPWAAFREMAGCGWDRAPEQGYHGARHTFPVRLIAREHPILAGLPESLPATDELYHGMTVQPHAQVLATALDSPDRGGTGRDEPMLVVTRFGKGRVFTTVLGHEVPGMWEDAFRIPFVRGTEWAASGQVTLPPDAGMPKPPARPLRALVVTGGHEYQTSFYSLFEGHPELVWDHAPAHESAFARDLRPRYDVLVLYDLSPDLSATGRTNLRAFVEAGRGVIALHHAAADYPGWEWWWKEVIGGRYVLQAEPGFPASGYREGVWLTVEPAGNHPITAGIGPLRLFDETYRGLWIAPTSKPLLRTTHPTSDPVVGWISAYPASRVVYLQPGHGAESHRHPAYRQLIRNAILWAGKRPE